MYLTPPTLRMSDGKERHATWLELFFDLVFVVSITQLSDSLLHNLSWLGLTKFIALFIPIWWTWTMHTVYSTRFDADDAVHLTGTFIVMFAAAIMTVQIPVAFGIGANGFAFGFILSGVTMLLFYARILYFLPNLKSMAILYLIGFGSGIFCWFISLFFPIPLKFWWWGIGFLIVYLTPWLGKAILIKFPLDTTHIPERFGLFTIIVLGETVAAVILGLVHTQWSLLSICYGIAGFILAIIIWLQYYSYFQTADYKCSLQSGQPFIYAHLPLAISLVMMGIGVEAEITSLVNLYRPEDISHFFCAGCILWLISFYLVQKTSRKKPAIFWIYCVAILLILIMFYLFLLQPLKLIIGLDVIFYMVYLFRKGLR